ncbi:MAG: O-acetyl-ADP-ribose deacetylase [Candidatus Caldatribacteriota bacterium]|nr:O-acetyl-ADP-ribose deacetylase [Candidatus Caldatribacteriota bacterium]
MSTGIEVLQGDITKQKVDVIVNAANTSLLGGGGVDGAIHRAAGPELLEECRKLKGCSVGKAKITRGYNLPAKWVIHTVGPVWKGGAKKEDEYLAQCYQNCFSLAEKYKLQSIAFPAISTGVYRFPLERATKIAIKETRNFFKKGHSIKKVIFTCFSKEAYICYMKILKNCESENIEL